MHGLAWAILSLAIFAIVVGAIGINRARTPDGAYLSATLGVVGLIGAIGAVTALVAFAP
jgi:hypothetical protein